MNKSAVVRKKDMRGRSKLNVKVDIIRILKKSKKPISTSDLMIELKKAWHTIDRGCLMLQIDGKIEGFKVGKMNLWEIKCKNDKQS